MDINRLIAIRENDRFLIGKSANGKEISGRDIKNAIIRIERDLRVNLPNRYYMNPGLSEHPMFAN